MRQKRRLMAGSPTVQIAIVAAVAHINYVTVNVLSVIELEAIAANETRNYREFGAHGHSRDLQEGAHLVER
jgi:hypothetical protein